MLNSEETTRAIEVMGEMFPNATTSLTKTDPYHFMLSVILSAQTTDKAVNLVTPALFERYKTPVDLANASQAEVESYIKTIGLYRNKARFLIKCSQELVERFNGVVPKTRKELMSLSGVGRKTADVVLAECFGIPAFAVDTHVSRVAKRLGMVPADSDVLTIEKILMQKVPQDLWIKGHHRMIFWGRYQCMARNPKCSYCPLLDICPEGRSRV
ncbi:MAG: endonuclease III [Ligilactobacillus animalis]|uniref:endonuclease III n=1 Tax=Ligilactobacillus animalis TaxID=1605 RepID=UPI00242D6B31|nr:endonuclease III [Ligilactobacillus animalis]MCI5941416.1 endonuclease III [Ligilactobacillus animalis]MDY2992281.1 endonuclease III [Ligilactobacillus animalis]